MSIQDELKKLKAPLQDLGLYNISNNTLLHCELSAYAVGFDIINRNLVNTEKEMFIVTSEDYGITYRENLFNRQMSYSDIEKRRNMLIYENSITSNDYNLSGIKKAVSSCAINCDIYEYLDTGYLFLDCHEITDINISKEKAIELAQKFMPVHLNVVFDFRKINWDKLDQRELSFSQLDSLNMSWDDIDNYDI